MRLGHEDTVIIVINIAIIVITIIVITTIVITTIAIIVINTIVIIITKLRPIEQACGCSTSRGGGGVKVRARLCRWHSGGECLSP
jgi:hypothetical protein